MVSWENRGGEADVNESVDVLGSASDDASAAIDGMVVLASVTARARARRVGVNFIRVGGVKVRLYQRMRRCRCALRGAL